MQGKGGMGHMSGSEIRVRRGLSEVQTVVQYPGRHIRRLSISWGIGVIAIFLAGSDIAMCQFAVTPMKLETTVRPRVTIKTEINCENHFNAEVHYITLSTVELTQNEDGSWLPIDPNKMDPNHPIDLSKITSCRSWIELPQTGGDEITVGPLQTKSIPIEIAVPAGVKGFFSAGIVVSLKARKDTMGVGLQYDFIVPVLLQIEGSALYHKIQLVDGGLEAVPQSDDASASTLVTLSIDNTGSTKSRLSPRAQVRVYDNDTWRVIVRDLKFPDVDIIPGSHLKLKYNIDRALPAKNYLVTGALFIDGKRAKSIDKEVNFEGDKSTTAIHADAVIEMDPSTILLETTPGSMKTDTIKVRNDSDDPVTIRAHILTSKGLAGFIQGGKKGDDLSCADWIEIRPSEFELQKYGSRNIQVISKMPEGTLDYRGFYADLNLFASYADGTNAGMTTAQICVVNKKMQYNPVVEGRNIKVENTEPSKYIVSARFLNVGDVHVSPKCEARLVETDGTVIKSGKMDSDGKSPVMLPLEQRDFSGDLDLTYIKPGFYRVMARLDYNPIVELDYTKAGSTKSSGEIKTPSWTKNSDARYVVVGKPVQIKLDENNYRVIEFISDTAYKQEASKARGAIKW
jgi:hypothetical protein